METRLFIPVGIVVARERIGDPWRDDAWHAVSAFLNAPDLDDWRELHRSESIIHYHAATLELTLDAREAGTYAGALAGQPPQFFCVLRRLRHGKWPVAPYHVTVSPEEAGGYGGLAGETVEAVAMPDDLCALLASFLAHYRPGA